jgi:hypothetical protein
VAEQIVRLTSEADVVRFLDADPRLGAPDLREVASELSIEIPPNVMAKPALQVHFAQTVILDRGHWNWR